MTVVSISRGSRPTGRRVAIVGSGVSGSSAAWALANTHDVTLLEADSRPGGHTATVTIDYDGHPVSVDTGFIVYNQHTYPELTALFDVLGVKTHDSNMGFSLSSDDGRLEWSGENLRSIFSQKRNLFSPTFLWMLREILRFNRQCVEDRDAGRLGHSTIGEYLSIRRFSRSFRENYLIPMAAAIWSTPHAEMLHYPASSFIGFFENHRLINSERPVWRTVTGGSKTYLDKLLAPLGSRLQLASPVQTVLRNNDHVAVHREGRTTQTFDEVIIATHSDQALALLGDASPLETRLLSGIAYRPNRVILHRDPRLMPKRKGCWSAWNYMRRGDPAAEGSVSVTYWMNRLQGIEDSRPLFVSLNPVIEPREELVFGEWNYAHPQFDKAALAAQARLSDIQGVRHTQFAGAWTGHGFHEDGLRSGLNAAAALGAIIPWREPTTVPALAAE